MKRYRVYADEHDDYGLVTVQVESDNGDYVLYGEAQAEIDRLKVEKDELLTTQYELADLVESALSIIDRGGWAEISAELRVAIAKARGES